MQAFSNLVKMAEACGQAEATKTWHDAKFIKKRTKFLLNNLDTIPTDITFRVGPAGNVEDISAHKLILAIGSGVFHAMFYGNLKEKKQIIRVPDVVPHAFRLMLKYFYTEAYDGLSMESVMDTLYCAKKYLVLRLIKACRVFVQETLTPATACSIIVQASRYSEEKLEELAAIVISHQAVKAFDSPAFLELPAVLLRQLLQRNDLSAAEYELYKSVRRWVMGNKLPSESIQEAFAGVLDCIRLPMLSPAELANGPVEDGAVSDGELKLLYQHSFALVKPSIRFSALKRQPHQHRFYGVLKVALEPTADPDPDDIHDESPLIGLLHLEVFSDVVPECSELFCDLSSPGMVFYLFYGNSSFGEFETMPGDDVLPVENDLLPFVPFWVTMRRRRDQNKVYAASMRICHPTVNKPRLEGETVFARLVCGVDVLNRLDSAFGSLILDWDKSVAERRSGIIDVGIPAAFTVRKESSKSPTDYFDYLKT